MLFTLNFADFGTCRFDEELCSCKIGEANQGLCWDKVVGQPGRCSKRFCRAGWTCACTGRTHVCKVGDKTVNALVNEADKTQAIADCETKTRSMVDSVDISLGTIKIHISKAGIKANDCTQIAWWHNGILLGNRRLVDGITEANDAVVTSEQIAREDHSLIELRPNDVIAFRFKEASYYCYKHLTEMVMNGTSIDTNMGFVSTFYAREFSTNWFLPSFELNESNTAQDETETDLKKFLPLRKNKLVSGDVLITGTDYWQPRDDANADNKRSNWYYRIHISENTGPVVSNELR